MVRIRQTRADPTRSAKSKHRYQRREKQPEKGRRASDPPARTDDMTLNFTLLHNTCG